MGGAGGALYPDWDWLGRLLDPPPTKLLFT